jgi:hypothetical protein
MLKALANSPGRLQGFSKRRDRRAAFRCSPFRMTACYLTSPTDGIATSATVYDISASGAGIVGSPLIAPGTVVHLELFNAGYTFVLVLDLRVTRAEAASKGGHYLGGEFTRKLTYDELLPFLI